MQNPLISVLLPTYNCDKYINECMDSILCQTYSNFELLIIDDCSTDNTVNLIQDYKDERIKLTIKEKNSGITDSLNWGINNCKGEYIARMDGDDISLPTRFEEQVAFMEGNQEIVLCGTQYSVLGENKLCNHPLTHDEIKVKLLSGCYIAHPTVMFRKDFFIENQLKYDIESEFSEDYELWSRLVFIGKVANLNRVLLLYRVHQTQTSNVRSTKQKQISNTIKDNLLSKLETPHELKASFSPKNIEDYFKAQKYLNYLSDKNKKKHVFNTLYFDVFINETKKNMDNNFSYVKINVVSYFMLLVRNFSFFYNIGLKKNIKLFLKLFVNLLNPSFSQVIRRKIKFVDQKIKNIRFYFYSRKVKINPFQIPILIISYNQLKNLNLLVTFLLDNGYQNIVIIDNNSTYLPLKAYLKEMEGKIEVCYLNKNFGHTVFWKNKKLIDNYGQNYFALTDPDIIPDTNCPSDFMSYFLKQLNANLSVNKVGFSLLTDDIPDFNKDKEIIINWEKQFKTRKTKSGDFIADIDTTFALYRPNKFMNSLFFFKALRTKKPYFARHGGWYINQNSLSDEEQFYINSANSSSSWLSEFSTLKEKYS